MNKRFSSFNQAILSPTNVHRLHKPNAPELDRLITEHTRALFGSISAYEHITQRFLSLGVYDDDANLVAAICLESYPNISSLPPWEWRHWLKSLYHVDDIVPYTTLWCHYAVYEPIYTLLFLKPILQFFFQEYESMEKVVFVCPPGVARVNFLEQGSVRLLPVGFVNPRTVQTLYVLKREDFVCHYTIRRAVEEDNDDLVAIIPSIVEEHYGPYYIAELLSMEDTGRHIIVAEHEGCAVGVLCLNEVVNYDLLNENFELVVYNGLRKAHDDDEIISQSLSNVGFALCDEIEQQSVQALEGDSTLQTEADLEEQLDAHSEDDYSLFNISSSLLLRYLYDDKDEDTLMDGSSHSSVSIDGDANEEYADHIYKAAHDQETSVLIYAQSKNLDEAPIPMFYGDANAFTLEISASLPDHETSLYLLCQAAFECFPDRDYCVVSFPPSASCPYLNKHFGSVMHRPNSTFHHELYVLHRNAILGELSVRSPTPDDCDAVRALARKFQAEAVWRRFERAMTTDDDSKASNSDESISGLVSDEDEESDENLRAFVFLCEDEIIGCAVLNEEQYFEYLRLTYSIETWLNVEDINKFGAYGTIECCLLSPIFQRHQNFFIRELHRFGNYYALFYKLRRNDFLLTSKLLPVVNVIGVMAPVIKQPRIQYNDEIFEEFEFPLSFYDPCENFSLFVSNSKLMSQPVYEINDRIVIIGSGTTTMAFLESLIFTKNTKVRVDFTKLTIVTTYDIFAHKTRKLDETVFVKRTGVEDRHQDYIWLKTYVNMVTGVMTGIERREKYIVLNDESYIHYDKLILLCGEQFQKPQIQHKKVARKKTEMPGNAFILNNPMDVMQSLHVLKSLDSTKKNGTMVVFGHYLESLCCLTALLDAGISGTSLVYVDPSPDANPSNARHDHLSQFFNNSSVENTVLDKLLHAGITVYQDYNIIDWYFENENENWITSAKFESKYKFIEIELVGLYLFHSRTVSPRTFHAIIRAGLVFNGQLVIDKDFRTNDPNIYSAGPLTKYSQRYHAEDQMHKYFNSTEVGYELGKKIREMSLPNEYKEYPKFEALGNMPISQYCRFPGNLHYLQISKPGRPIPLEVAKNKGHYGKVIVTGATNLLKDRGYFRLHLNQFNKIETITCLSKDEFNVKHLISLYGKHESLFNNMLYRFENNLLEDLFEYFEQPWMYAIYHIEFESIMHKCNELFDSICTENGAPLIEEIRQMCAENAWNVLPKIKLDEFKALCKKTDLNNAMVKKVLTFLDTNLTYLPMYAHHILIRWIIGCNRNNPLFHENRGYGEYLPVTYLKRRKPGKSSMVLIKPFESK